MQGNVIMGGEGTKTALIVGYGVSGKGAEKFLQDNGWRTIIWDDGRRRRNSVADSGKLSAVTLCVVSPAVDYGHQVVQQMAERGVPIIAEIELPFLIEKIRAKIVAVTGTNGKTTVVSQIHDAMENSGKRAVLCGNIGTPITAVANALRGAVGVVEVSSFMLQPSANRIEYGDLFHPKIAVITNITQDHLERHGTMDEYIRCKKQIFANQTGRDILILNHDDANCRAVGNEIIALRKSKRRAIGVPRVIWYSGTHRVRGFYIENGQPQKSTAGGCCNGVIYKNLRGRAKPVFAVAETNENTPHGISNMLAVICVCHALRLKKRAVLSAVTHKTRPNRLERVGEKNGIVFYNDSKATNIASTLAGCRSFSLPTALILCGLTKGQNYSELFENLPDTVKNVVVFGSCKPAVIGCAKTAGYKNVFEADSMETAVQTAVEKCVPPAVILFSPAGSSFDMFADYVERGQKFREAVKKINLQHG
jgi:UDP-N-acetylmuramoylalanine--D-glutamate ligase